MKVLCGKNEYRPAHLACCEAQEGRRGWRLENARDQLLGATNWEGTIAIQYGMSSN